ncbi:MAG: TlpA disulfide reductase family protein [Acidobacteriota bacterium]
MRKTTVFISLLTLVLVSFTANGAGELVRLVRNKLSAGDLASGAAATEEYKKKNGVDAEYLDAVGWLARGAEMLKQPEVAAAYVAELRREIREEKPELLSPLGAAIEVEGRLRAAREGRGAGIRFLEEEFARAKDIGLRSRIRKTINLLSLEGQPAPELNIGNFVGPQPSSLAALKGKPVLLFLWAHWCGDCKAQAATLASVTRKYRPQGLVVMAPTRTYGTGAESKPATPAEEKSHIEKAWAESYAGLEGVPITIDTDTMVRYGVSATPTFALIDRKGVVRFYSPTRLSEAELSRRIEAVLAEAP